MKLNLKKFQRSSTSQSAAPQKTVTSDPYLSAQHQWLERYGTYIQQAYNWRLLALLEAVGLIVAVIGLIYVNTQSKLVPYVVAIDKIGTAIAVQPADRASPVDTRVVRAQLANWMTAVRAVTPDRYAEHRNLDLVYALVGDDSPARGTLDDYYRDKSHDPFLRATEGIVEIKIISVLPYTPLTYEVQWSETSRDLHGNATGPPSLWIAHCMIAFRPPTEEAEILRNPLGVFVTSLEWQKKI